MHHLGKTMQRRIGEEFAVDVHAGPADIAAAAEPAQRAIEEREEIGTLQRLLDAGPKRGGAWDAGYTWSVAASCGHTRG